MLSSKKNDYHTTATTKLLTKTWSPFFGLSGTLTGPSHPWSSSVSLLLESPNTHAPPPSPFYHFYLIQVSAYHLSRGHALYFNGQISEAHADYRRALELDPGNAEARRLCFQFGMKKGGGARTLPGMLAPLLTTMYHKASFHPSDRS